MRIDEFKKTPSSLSTQDLTRFLLVGFDLTIATATDPPGIESLSIAEYNNIVLSSAEYNNTVLSVSEYNNITLSMEE